MFKSLTGCVALGKVLCLCASVPPSVKRMVVRVGQRHAGCSPTVCISLWAHSEARVPSLPHSQVGSHEGVLAMGVEVTLPPPGLAPQPPADAPVEVGGAAKP